jgi:hypothetical protein
MHLFLFDYFSNLNHKHVMLEITKTHPFFWLSSVHKHKEQTYASLHHKPSHELELTIARFLPFAFQYLSIHPTGYQSNPSRYQTKRSWVRVLAAPFFVISFFTVFLNTLLICPKPNLCHYRILIRFIYFKLANSSLQVHTI